MPTPTYTPIASQTLAVAAASVNFTSIPQIYRDLVLVCKNVTGGIVAIRFNSNSSNFYSSIRMSGDGSSPTSGTFSNTYFSPAHLCDPGTDYSLIMDIFDINQTNKHKSVLAAADNVGQGTERFAMRWAQTSAITSVNIFNATGGNLNIGGTYALYGVIA